jgi:hypothetical protein
VAAKARIQPLTPASFSLSEMADGGTCKDSTGITSTSTSLGHWIHTHRGGLEISGIVLLFSPVFSVISDNTSKSRTLYYNVPNSTLNGVSNVKAFNSTSERQDCNTMSVEFQKKV